MSIQRQSVALLGASGLVGGFCLRALLADADFRQITLLNRRELGLASDSRVTEKRVSFERLVADDFGAVDSVFCALGTTISKAGSQEAFRTVDLEYPLKAARAALQAGARQFLLVSSVGADSQSRNFYLRTKGKLEKELETLHFQALHIFRPSLLLGRRQELRRGERIMTELAPALNVFMISGLRRYRAISAESVGRAMLVAAKKGIQGKHVYHYDEIMHLASP